MKVISVEETHKHIIIKPGDTFCILEAGQAGYANYDPDDYIVMYEHHSVHASPSMAECLHVLKAITEFVIDTREKGILEIPLIVHQYKKETA